MRRGDDQAERTAIIEATHRLLLGQPIHSNGSLTISALADEVRLPDGSPIKRELLTKKHTDLRDQFQALAARCALDNAAPQVQRLREQITDLERRNAKLRQTNAEQLQDIQNYAENLVLAAIAERTARRDAERSQHAAARRERALKREIDRLNESLSADG